MNLKKFFVSLLAAAATYYGLNTDGHAEERKKIVVIITEFSRMSHAEVIVGRLVKGYFHNGNRITPQVDIVSMYLDQIPNRDMGREIAAEHGIPLFSSIRKTLTLDGEDLAVDGVIIIGEHGNYPFNIKGQQLYPRYYFYKQVMDVFRASGRCVPVFNDKYLSYDWDEAKWMYDHSVALGFPLMAGSSLPFTWREPELELELGTPIERAVVTHYGPKERYVCHTLDLLQCMVERREGGETGISAVQCFEGDSVWKWTDANPWAERLMLEAISRTPERKPGSPRENVSNPYLFVLEYTSGLTTASYLLNGHVQSAAFAADIRGKSKPVSTHFVHQNRRPYAHFSGLVYHVEQMMLTGKEQFPIERVLLTTGAQAALFESSYENGRTIQKGKRVVTPNLDIAYRARKESLFNRGPMPPTEKDFGIGP